MRQLLRTFPLAGLLPGILGPVGPASATPPELEADYSGQIHVVASADFAASPLHLDVEGHHAFVGTYSDGVLVFDLSDPLNPLPVGAAPVPDLVNGVLVRDGVLYVAAHLTGVMTFDVTEPGSPRLLGSVDTPGYARRLALDPPTGPVQRAFVAGDWRGIQVIDLGDPSNPVLVDSLETERANDVIHSDGYLYVADGSAGTLVVDVRGGLQVVAVMDEPGSVAVALVDETLYIGGSDYFQVYDVSDPLAPVERGRAEIGGYYGVGYNVRAMHVGDGVACLAAEQQGLYLVDVSDGDHPEVFWGMRARTTEGVDRRGPYVVTVHDWGVEAALLVTDTRGRRSPAPVGFLPASGVVADVAVSEDLAYCVGDSLRIVDVSDVIHPELLGGISTYYGGHEVALADYPYLIFVESSAKRLNVVDVSVSSAPQIVASVAPSEVYDLHGLEVVGSFAHVGARLRPASVAGLVVFDLTNPLSPTIVATQQLAGGHARNVKVVDDIAYVVTTGTIDNGLSLVDVSTPPQPVVLSELPLGGCVDVVVRDGLAFVAEDYEGLNIVDVSDPYAPHLVSQLGAVSRAFDVALDGDFAYVSSAWWGVNVVDISDPQTPVLIGATMVPPDQVGVAGAVAFHGGLVYSGGNKGLAILPRHVPSRTEGLAAGLTSGPVSALSAGRPNPFEAGTTLTFSASRRGAVRVTVHDVAGRLVRELLHGTVAPGPHEVRWDGRDRAGQSSASGVYFVRLDLEGRTHVRSIQRVR